MYTLSLSPRYLYEPDGAGSLKRVIGALNSTISVPDTAIAEYSPTVTVNIPGATPVNFTSQPICEGFFNVQIWCIFHCIFQSRSEMSICRYSSQTYSAV